ncbi:division/cell wall cluster transcriptional repressor MraZ [Alteriqipengyuania flavescens]|uniref:division/cell wall cluster transcriptional repressor MraZ n=1 Tax=Alteriqipengyuania flavescens TaxID=3053610 RepID=UPI0025B402A3|nr:division/cell wall cluster transcriptional repressor MraZ [Alteriqipengyuania flavescens]WJY19077.1 division/cell wall cluster transcriptional repressor MraZ [Alteriqipengyuania flavescens]WJY25018.1 division/cell wall cluster transcriptional repressor MraZ [Alteriqipengyuania flavescens]
MATGAGTDFNGQGFSLRGEKSRFVLPVSLRKQVAAESDGRILCVGKHERWDCLIGFGLSRIKSFADQIDREEERALRLGRDYDPELRRMQLFAFTEIPFDASGRFILPDHLSKLGGIEGGVYFHGAGDFIHMWNPDLLAKMGAGWESAQAYCETTMAEAQAKAAK